LALVARDESDSAIQSGGKADGVKLFGLAANTSAIDVSRCTSVRGKRKAGGYRQAKWRGRRVGTDTLGGVEGGWHPTARGQKGGLPLDSLEG